MIYLVSAEQFIFDIPDIRIVSVEESLDILAKIDVVGLDTETTGLDPYTKELKLVQLGCKDFQVVIDTTTINILRYKDYLESNRLFLLWNAKFDLKWFYKYGIIIKNVYDGFLAEKLLYLGYPAGMHSLSLKAAGEKYLNVELDKTVRGKIIYSKLDEEIIRYGANDVKWLQELKNKQYEELEKKDLLVALDIENRFVRVLAYIEWCGIKLSIDKWKKKMANDLAREEAAKDRLDAWLIVNQPNSKYVYVDYQGDLFLGFDLTPKVSINWNSAKQVGPILKEYGVDIAVEDKDKGGVKDSIDAKVLKPQADKCSLIPLYLEYKEAVKVTSTYEQNFLDQINPVSGRIHTSYQQMGADTTRITSGGKDKDSRTEYVNLLNIPSDAETRACFVAEEGNSWISIDYVGQETCLMASIANDKAIIDELTNGSGDMHSLVAKMVFKDQIPADFPVKRIKKEFHELRQLAKGYEFLFNYGGSAETIMSNYGKTKEEATQIYNNYMSGFTGLKRYQDFCRKDWFDKGFILLNEQTRHKAYIYDYEELLKDKEWMKTLDWDYYREMKKSCPECDTVQRVRHFFKRKAASEKQSINYRIQATGSMCLRVALINFFSYICDNNLFNIVKINVTPYDEINCEAPKDIAENIATVVYNCMVKAGSIFCTRCKLDADISRNDDGTLPDYWIH